MFLTSCPLLCLYMILHINILLESYIRTLRPVSDEQFSQAIFWQSNIFLKKYCFCFSKSAEITMNWDFQFTRWRRKISFIAISLYLFIAILLVKIAHLTFFVWPYFHFSKLSCTPIVQFLEDQDILHIALYVLNTICMISLSLQRDKTDKQDLLYTISCTILMLLQLLHF